MKTTQTCPGCGETLPPDAPNGLCPQCLMQAGLPTGVDIGPDTHDGAGRVPFSAPSAEDLASYFPQLEILELIGRGGMGAVYKARQKQLDRFVAVKILPPGSGDDPAFAERFTREAKALAKLNHPNIVTLHEFGQTDGLFYFIMEFVDGLNLRQLLEAGRIAPREALAIVPQICDALQYAHHASIVHRDIKPENILLDRRGRVKVADFGLAKIVGGASPSSDPSDQSDQSDHPSQPVTTTETGKIMGTPPYMAPEQTDHPSEVDHRADIYSLGVVFYQMLTGELPAGKTFEPPSSRMRGLVVDVRLDEVVLRALEKEPARRYQQVSEVKTMIETIVTTPPAGPGREQPKGVWQSLKAGKPEAEWEGRAPGWRIRCCTCGFTEHFGKYGIRMAAAGTKYTLGRCQCCNRIRIQIIEKGLAPTSQEAPPVTATNPPLTRAVWSWSHIVMVGRRGGKAVINWPGVATVFLMILALVQAGGALFCLALETPMDARALVTGLFWAVAATGIGLGRARTTPLERLVDLDEPPTGQAQSPRFSNPVAISGAILGAVCGMMGVMYIAMLPSDTSPWRKLLLSLFISAIVGFVFVWGARLGAKSVRGTVLPPGTRASRRWRIAGWPLILAVALVLAVRAFVLAPFRVMTDAVGTEIPRKSFVLAFKLARTFSPGDVVVYRHGQQAVLGRVTQTGPRDGVLRISRRGETSQPVPIAQVVGRVILNTRAGGSDAPGSAAAALSEWLQDSTSDVQADGTIRFKTLAESVNRQAQSVETDEFVNSKFVHVEKITDAHGWPVHFEARPEGKDHFRYHLTLNEPVPPGGRITTVTEGLAVGLVKGTDQRGLFEYRMNHWPACNTVTHRIELHRLPPGAELVAKSGNLVAGSAGGRMELRADCRIPPGGNVEVWYRYRLPDGIPAGDLSLTASEAEVVAVGTMLRGMKEQGESVGVTYYDAARDETGEPWVLTMGKDQPRAERIGAAGLDMRLGDKPGEFATVTGLGAAYVERTGRMFPLNGTLLFVLGSAPPNEAARGPGYQREFVRRASQLEPRELLRCMETARKLPDRSLQVSSGDIIGLLTNDGDLWIAQVGTVDLKSMTLLTQPAGRMPLDIYRKTVQPFGEAVESIIPDWDFGRSGARYLDLDAGRTLAVPAEIKKDELGRTRQWYQWQRRRGVDLEVVVKGGTCYASGMDAAAVQVDNNEWDTLSPEQLATYEPLCRPESRNFILTLKDFPATYGVKTREGGMGILQFTGFTDNPRGVKIHFKMLRAAGASSAEK
jgi:hypothetical protein